MSNNDYIGSPDIICRKIEEEADSQIQSIMARTREEKEKLLEDARKKSQQILADYRNKLEKEKAKIQAKAHSSLVLKEKNLKNEFYEYMAEFAKEKAFVLVRRIRNTPAYKDIIKRFSLEAAEVIGEEKIKIYLSAMDKEMLDGKFLEELACQIKEQHNVYAEFEFAAFEDGGIKAEDTEGRKLFVCTFSQAFKEKQQEILNIIYQKANQIWQHRLEK